MNYNDVFNSFSNFRVVVIGDVMLDNYKIGKVHRMSPEAPVPVVLFEKEENRIGGAGNVALNLIALGAKPIVCSVIGNDDTGKILIDKFNENNISTAGIFQSSDRQTTVKSRIISNHQQLLRIDTETTEPITTEESQQVMNRLELLLNDGIDAIIFEDYNKGVLTEELIQGILSFSKKNKIVTCVDPKFDNFLAFKSVDLFKPNLKELKEGLKCDINMHTSPDKLIEVVTLLESKLNNIIEMIGIFNSPFLFSRGLDGVLGFSKALDLLSIFQLIHRFQIRELQGLSNH